ncbi:hypothetical protein DOI34_24975, partial [Salmonella enterica subsp. enterica serovar Virchow]|nr:hypothetical protein [Salmonella enterica subsp. enterica serovar Virchow]
MKNPVNTDWDVHIHATCIMPDPVMPGDKLDIAVHGVAVCASGDIEIVELRLAGQHATSMFQAYPSTVRTAVFDRTPSMQQVFCGFTTTWSGTAPNSGDYPANLRVIYRSNGFQHFSEWVELGRLHVRRPVIRKRSSHVARVEIAMATFNPDPVLFRRQINSIQAQTLQDWRLRVFDESETPQARAMVMELAVDPRIEIVHGPRRGFLGNFERAMRMVDLRAPYFALTDQDDEWRPDKLERLIDFIETTGADLVHCDMRVVDKSGKILAPSYWTWRRRHAEDFEALLTANTVSGAALLCRTDLLRSALPLPHLPGVFHDMWLALLASARGGVRFLDHALLDYVQHGANVVGSAGGDDDRAAANLFAGQASQFAALLNNILTDSEPGQTAVQSAVSRLPDLAVVADELARRIFLRQAAINRLGTCLPDQSGFLPDDP